ncbi:MAG: isoprenylcysteine carboxylmethyltransferase family protein [Nitrospira sp.]|nr:isoprenylcysteine carboxylmethyltransferase family protein [Nitrospira sp.]
MLKSVRHFVGYHRIILSGMVGVLLYVFAKPTVWTIIAGCPIILIGEGIRIWSSGYITKNQMLVQDGPYAFMRHPLYLGTFVIGLGFAIMGAKISLIVLYLIAFTIIYFSTIAEEEESLRHRFGNEFFEYARQVPLFVPLPTAAMSGQTKFQWQRVMGHREYKTWLAIGIFLVLMFFKSYYVS